MGRRSVCFNHLEVKTPTTDRTRSKDKAGNSRIIFEANSMSANHILTTGDIVKLKQPYCPEEWVLLKDKAWRGFEYGIVVEIISSQFSVNGEAKGSQQQPRKVGLHLYDATGQLMIYPQYLEKGLLVPTYVDFHLLELVLYRIASQDGYETVLEPPDWDKVWDDEVSIMKEFGVDL